jgi:hypothetical protein
MKKIIVSILSVAALICSTWSIYGTGTIGPNANQTGVITYTATSGSVQTNTFPFPYLTPPIVQVYSQNGTNGTPFTLGTVTTTNFVLTSTFGTTTNSAAVWSAFTGYPRIQFGTNWQAAATFVTNTFNPSYFYPPSLSVDGGNTNTTATMSILFVTTTNFCIYNNLANTNYWQAIGIATSPGYNPVSY